MFETNKDAIIAGLEKHFDIHTEDFASNVGGIGNLKYEMLDAARRVVDAVYNIQTASPAKNKEGCIVSAILYAVYKKFNEKHLIEKKTMEDIAKYGLCTSQISNSYKPIAPIMQELSFDDIFESVKRDADAPAIFSKFNFRQLKFEIREFHQKYGGKFYDDELIEATKNITALVYSGKRPDEPYENGLGCIVAAIIEETHEIFSKRYAFIEPIESFSEYLMADKRYCNDKNIEKIRNTLIKPKIKGVNMNEFLGEIYKRISTKIEKHKKELIEKPENPLVPVKLLAYPTGEETDDVERLNTLFSK